MEKKMGRPTNLVEVNTVCHTACRSCTSMPDCSKCRNAFSVTTMPASTSTPIAMAMPASDMMFDVTFR